MTNPALLNNVQHQRLRVITRYAREFGHSVNQVLVFPTEFAEIQREYPILLSKAPGGEFQAVALLGFDKDENVFLEDRGWAARYVPAVLARGPFSIGLPRDASDGAEPMIHVDLDDKRVNEREGEPVFLPQGGNSAYLDHIALMLRVIHEGVAVAKRLYAAWEQEGLIAPLAVEIKVSDTKQYNIANFFTIATDKLAQLDGAALERLHKHGFLQPAFLMLSSLGNVARLIEMKNRRGAAG